MAESFKFKRSESDKETVYGCWNKADGSKEDVIIVKAFKKDSSNLAYKQYLDKDGNEVTIGTGESVTLGQCKIEYDTELASEFFEGSISAPTAPPNTRQFVVINDSSAWLEFVTNQGTQICPAGGTIVVELFNHEDALTFTAVNIISGTFASNGKVAINYKTVA